MKFLVATVATVTALGVPSVAQAATLTAEPSLPCYREMESVFLPGAGFTPNAQVNFSRDGAALQADPPIVADAAGGVSATLTLPGLLSGERTLSYLATDGSNPANTAQLDLLVTATKVSLSPRQGEPERVLKMRARGFFGGGKNLWAHVVRGGRRKARNLKIGRIKGACKTVKARRRVFSASAPSGAYRVQFDAFKRYRKNREVKDVYNVTITRTVRPAAAAAVPTWRRIG
jgi:hypothetical protein